MTTEWMLTEHEVCDIYAKEGTTRNEAWMAIANEAQKKLLESLKNSTFSIDNPYGKDHEVITKDMIEFMLQKMEEK